MRETVRSVEYASPFADVALVYFNRFLSPYNAHVVSSDTLARAIDPATCCVWSCRLQRKSRKSMPKWLPGRLAAIRDTWVIETSVVDPLGRVLYSASRNIDHRANADGIEWQRFSATGSASVTSETTFSIASATASSSAIGPWVQSKLEAAFIAGFRVSHEKTRANYLFLLGVLADGKLRRPYLIGNTDPNFSRGLPLASTMAHAEGTLAGFTGHGVRDPDQRYQTIDVQRPRRSWWPPDMRWQRRVREIDAEAPVDWTWLGWARDILGQVRLPRLKSVTESDSRSETTNAPRVSDGPDVRQ